MAAGSPPREEPVNTENGLWSRGGIQKHGGAKGHLLAIRKPKPISILMEDSGLWRTQDPGILLSYLNHSAPFPTLAPQVGCLTRWPEMPPQVNFIKKVCF